jgi:hypothetical protein
VCPDVEVFVAIAGGAVPVALDVVGDFVGHDGWFREEDRMVLI